MKIVETDISSGRRRPDRIVATRVDSESEGAVMVAALNNTYGREAYDTSPSLYVLVENQHHLHTGDSNG